MKKFIFLLGLALVATITYAQDLTQTVRGTILDLDSEMPLIGAAVVIPNSDPFIGTTTDLDGNFKLENIPIGRTTLTISFLGYETQTIPNITVNSGKEVVLTINMQESLVNLREAVVTATEDKEEALNEMALISARSISTEQTERFAGSFNDPSRILANFAGVTSTQDGSNDIIVRGNAPKYVQWRLEGVEITNPNHFEDQNSSSGGVSALNNNLLATSDFYTGAFSAEYGDVLSGVYDVKLRKGNNEKFEATFGFGIIGTDFTIEGPFKKGYGGSYLVNYRYSTISLINDLGLIDIDGVLKFQDAAFKVVLPTKRAGNFSLFGLAGVNSFELQDVKPDLWQTPGNNSLKNDITEDYDKNNYLLNAGVNHVLSINSKSYLKTTLAFSGNGISDDIFESRITETTIGPDVIVDTVDRTLNYTSNINTSIYRGAITYNNRISSRHKIQVGSRYSLHDYTNEQSKLNDDLSARYSLVDFTGNIGTLRNFVNWKLRVNENLTAVMGVHNMNVLFNHQSTIEPRAAFNLKLNDRNSVHAGYGNHSNMERVHNYLTTIQTPSGETTEPNRDLGLLRAHHFVLGYKRRFTQNLVAKVEVYYQDLYDLPVENNDTSFYATINEGLDYRFVDLVNEGTGKNYGVELSLERFFNQNFYYMLNTSLYESKYTALDGIERNTQFNGNYLVNLLAGKEFNNLGKKKNRTLAINTKVFYGGGKKIIPLLRDEQGNLAVDPANNQFWDYEKAYEEKIEDAFQITISMTYKINRPKATHEIFLSLDNITNNKGKISEFYDEDAPGSIGYQSQFGFFPNLMYRVYF